MTPDFLTRAGDQLPDAPDGAAPLHTLTTKQRTLLIIIEQYVRATGEPCSARYLARRLSVHHSTIQMHLCALHRKGWLLTPNAPAKPSRAVEDQPPLGIAV